MHVRDKAETDRERLASGGALCDNPQRYTLAVLTPRHRGKGAAMRCGRVRSRVAATLTIPALSLAGLTGGSTGIARATGPHTGQSICPPDAPAVNEPCGSDTSGGCSSFPFIFTDADCGDTWCGNGWAQGGVRDVDWFVVELSDPDGDGVEILSATVVSEFPAVCFIIRGDDPIECQPVLVASGCGDDGRNLEVASATLPAPREYGIVVAAGNCDGSGIFDGIPCGSGNAYSLAIDCHSLCPADLGGDGLVGVHDLLVLLAAWGSDPGGPPDFDADGTVGITDLLVLLASWGPCA
jgi:hypothetical protein